MRVVLDKEKSSANRVVNQVYFDEECFDDVEIIKTIEDCRNKKCKYLYECWKIEHDKKYYFSNCVRKFDCKKNLHILKGIYFFITTVILAYLLSYFVFGNFNKFVGLGLFFISGTIIDIICCTIEKKFPKIYDKLFYRKLKRVERKKQKQIDAEKLKKATEEFQKLSSSPYYKKVQDAEVLAKSLMKLSDEYNFGNINNKKVDECAKKLLEIVDVLKKDDSGYSRVIFLFETFVPEFYNLLSLYTNFLKADVVDDEKEKALTKFVDLFALHLKDQKIEAIFDKTSIEIQFKSSAEALTNMINKEIN